MIFNEIKISKVFIFLTILFMFTGLISLISVQLDLSILRLWKEIVIILLFCYSLIFGCFLRGNNKKKVVFLFLFVCLIFLIYFLCFLNDNPILIFYQIKNDIIPILFPISILMTLTSREAITFFINNYLRCIVIFTLFNAVLIFIQAMYTESFLIFLEIDSYNNQGGASGLRLDNTLGNLRAMGSMTSFINSGTLCLIAIFILVETKCYQGFKRWLFLGIIIAAGIASTYKTIYIALALYLFIRLIYLFLKNQIYQRVFLYFITITCFCFFSFIFNSMYIYDNYFRGTEYEDIGYNSIYLRVSQHNVIISDMEKEGSIYTGQGIGHNGTEGPPELKSSSKPLDSSFINILSNYGAFFTIGVIFSLLILQLYFTLRHGLLNNLACIIIFFILGIEFFANNFFMNFPPNVIFYTLLTISYLAIKYKITLTKK